MDDDDEDNSLLTAPGFQTSSESVESLLATLARDLLDHEILQSTFLSGGHPVMSSLKVSETETHAHLSLIIDMGGHQIKLFATVLAVESRWKPLSPPKVCMPVGNWSTICCARHLPGHSLNKGDRQASEGG